MRLSTAFVCVAFVIAGCGSDDSESTTTTSKSPPAATTASETPTPTKAAPAESGATEVDIQGFDYLPKTIEVAAGTKVTWTDSDKSNHTVTFAGDEPKDISNIRPGQKKAVTFSKPGTFAYVCAYHPGMAGTVEVK